MDIPQLTTIVRKSYGLGCKTCHSSVQCHASFRPQRPGVVGAACDTPDCMVELICDGFHIHPSTIRTTFKMFGEERVVLISDSMMATGMPNGKYELGGQEVTMKDHFAALADGTLAGSATNLFDCMKNAMKFGISEAAAIFAATRNPAKSIEYTIKSVLLHRENLRIWCWLMKIMRLNR